MLKRQMISENQHPPYPPRKGRVREMLRLGHSLPASSAPVIQGAFHGVGQRNKHELLLGIPIQHIFEFPRSGRGCNDTAVSQNFHRQQPRRIIESRSRIVVHLNCGPFERKAQEKAPVSGVGKYLRPEQNVSCRFCLPADGTRRYRSVTPESEFAAAYCIQTANGVEHKYHIGGLSADLPPEAASYEAEKDRVAPIPVLIADQQYPDSIAGAKYKPSLEQIGKNRNSVRAGQKTGGDCTFRECP